MKNFYHHLSSFHCFHLGVSFGLDVVNNFEFSRSGGRLLVITDGEENASPYISDIETEVNSLIS